MYDCTPAAGVVKLNAVEQQENRSNGAFQSQALR